MRKVLPLLCDLPRFNPLKSSKPMAESRCHGTCLTAWLMSWSRAMPARRLPWLPGRRRRTRAEICRHVLPIARSSLVAINLLIPTSMPITSPLSRACGSGNSTQTNSFFRQRAALDQAGTRPREPRVEHAGLARGDGDAFFGTQGRKSDHPIEASASRRNGHAVAKHGHALETEAHINQSYGDLSHSTIEPSRCHERTTFVCRACARRRRESGGR